MGDMQNQSTRATDNPTTTTGRIEVPPFALTVEYVAARYGNVLTYGGPGEQVTDGVRLARKLARAAGADLEDALEVIRERYRDTNGDD